MSSAGYCVANSCQLADFRTAIGATSNHPTVVQVGANEEVAYVVADNSVNLNDMLGLHM